MAPARRGHGRAEVSARPTLITPRGSCRGFVSGIFVSMSNCLGLPNIGVELVFDPCYAVHRW